MDLLSYALVPGFTALTVLALAAVARRLLGLRFGVLRTLLAGVIAFTLSGPLFVATRGGINSDTSGAAQFGLLVLAVMLALLAAMVFLVLAEVLVPAGSVPPPYEWWRLIRARAARTRRYGQIVRIAVRHGLGRALRGRWRAGADPARRQQLARSLTAALDEGGVTFVKLGQVLSTRRDLLPAEFVDELGRLQDRAAPAPWAEVEATLVAELGRPVAEVFASVSAEPLAAASVAQVHTGTLASGEQVVLKIQRAGIGPVV
ncbi:MAG TPA: AarF/UbiB family protein, partial [Actinomycetota bacterium]